MYKKKKKFLKYKLPSGVIEIKGLVSHNMKNSKDFKPNGA